MKLFRLYHGTEIALVPAIRPHRRSGRRCGPDRRRIGVARRRVPELILANRQDRVFDNETPTAGYAVFNLNASYTFMTGRVAHIFSAGGYNLGDRLYRNHLSFIKDFAPEAGRGVRLNYSLRF